MSDYSQGGQVYHVPVLPRVRASRPGNFIGVKDGHGNGPVATVKISPSAIGIERIADKEQEAKWLFGFHSRWLPLTVSTAPRLMRCTASAAKSCDVVPLVRRPHSVSHSPAW